MEHALPRRTAGIPRSWSLLLTSENHGAVGPLGSTFPHAGEKHERVQVVEIVAAGSPPAPGVDLSGLLRFDFSDLDGENEQFGEITNGAYFLAHQVEARCASAAPATTQAGQVVSAEELARFCPACGSVGDVGPAYRDCCPDGNEARLIPKRLAEKCHELFKVALSTMRAATPASPAQAAPLPAASVSAPAPAESIECWSHNEEDFNAQSLGELIDTHELQPGATVWVGEAVHPEPSSLFNTDWLIENMGEAAYDIAGEHGGEDYPNVSDEQVAELEALVVGWIAKCAPPTFWTVKNVRPYVLTAEDCGDQASTSGERQEGGAA